MSSRLGRVGVGLAGLWAGNVVDVPDAEDLPPPSAPGFWRPFAAYGPLAVWPNVEFWLPSVQIFGAVSLGVAMTVLTLAALMGLTWTSLALAALAASGRAGAPGRVGAGPRWAPSARTSAVAAPR